MKLLSKYARTLFFIVWLILMPLSFAAAETLEVVLSFPHPVTKVYMESIRIQGVIPLRVAIDDAGVLHLYQTPQAVLPSRLTVTLAKGALRFQDGSLNEALVQEVPLQQRTYAVNELPIVPSTPPPILSGVRSALTGLLLPFFAFNLDVLGYLRNLPTYLSALLAWILSAFGLRKYKKVPWGTVYNAITKDAIPFAIVRLVEGLSGNVRETQVTDRQGRFGFVPPVGLYRLEVVKAGFHYPSVIVKGMHDGARSPLYHRELTSIHGAHQSIVSYIPLDPAPGVPKHLSTIKRILVIFQGAVQKSAGIFFLMGVVSSVMLVLVLPTLTHMILLVVYALMALVQVSLVPSLPRPWGTVLNAQTGIPVALASVSLIETKYDRVVKTRLTDFDGRFYFLPTPGTYRLIVSAQGYRFPTEEKLHTQHGRNAYTGEVFTLHASDAVVNMDVPVDKLKQGGAIRSFDLMPGRMTGQNSVKLTSKQV